VPSIGDVFALYIEVESSSAGSYTNAPGFSVEPVSAVNINNEVYTSLSGSQGSNKWGIWVDGEWLKFTWDGNTWLCEDGRIPHNVYAYLSADTTGNAWADSTWTPIAFDTAPMDTAGLAPLSVSNNEFVIKRASRYYLSGFVEGKTTQSAGTPTTFKVSNNTTDNIVGRTIPGASSRPAVMGAGSFEAAAVDAISLQALTSGDQDFNGFVDRRCNCTVQEIF
jgi:hypothetical protein